MRKLQIYMVVCILAAALSPVNLSANQNITHRSITLAHFTAGLAVGGLYFNDAVSIELTYMQAMQLSDFRFQYNLLQNTWNTQGTYNQSINRWSRPVAYVDILNLSYILAQFLRQNADSVEQNRITATFFNQEVVINLSPINIYNNSLNEVMEEFERVWGNSLTWGFFGLPTDWIDISFPPTPVDLLGATLSDVLVPHGEDRFTWVPGNADGGDNQGPGLPPGNGIWASIFDFAIHTIIPREEFWEYQFDRLSGSLKDKLPFQTYIETIGRLREVTNALEGVYYSVFDITYELDGQNHQLDIGRHIAPHLGPIRTLVTGIYTILLAYYNYRQIMFLIRGRNYQSIGIEVCEVRQ